MTIGMLWFDNTQRPLRVRIEEAARHYELKYGAAPNKVFVSKAEKDLEAPAGIKVEVSRQVLKGHLWIGVEK